MKITLKMYATLGELLPPGARENTIEVEVADDATLNQIIDHYHVPRELAHLVLINGLFVCEEDRDLVGRFSAGDTLAIWPPVAGG